MPPLLIVVLVGCTHPDSPAKGDTDATDTQPADSAQPGDSRDTDTGTVDTGDSAADSADSTDSGDSAGETGETGDSGDTGTEALRDVASVSTAIIRGASKAATDAGSLTGYQVGISSIGDLDNDGVNDVLAGFPGEDDSGGEEVGGAFLFRGPVLGERSTATADGRMLAATAGELAGFAVDIAGDVNGDGSDDVIIGAPWFFGTAGQAYIVYGPVLGELSLADADVTLIAEDPPVEEWMGYAVAGAGDLNGDGFDDVMLAAPNNIGEVVVVDGPLSGTVDLDTSATARIDGDLRTAGLGGAAGDLDGDGLDDILTTIDASVGVGLFLGPVTGDLVGADADAAYAQPPHGSIALGVAVAGDTDGDGYADFVAGDGLDGSSGTRAGAAYLELGPLSGTHDLASADGSVYGAPDDVLGAAVTGLPDLDGDGRAEVVVSRAELDGVVFVFSGGFTGTVTEADAWRTIQGSGSECLGFTLRGGADVDGDSVPDLLIGAPAESSLYDHGGALYVVSGASLL